MLLQQLGELGNLHRAAEAISLAQPSASKMLRDIELAFGFPLFERSARGMGITELGRHVVEFAGSALVDFERFVADLEAKRRGGFGQLVVGGIMGAAPDVVARAVADLKKKRPLLAVRILGETSDQLLDLLQRRELDLAVGRFSAPMQHNRFDFEPLANELLCAVVRKGHPLCRARALTLADLMGWPWVLQLLSSPARQLMEDEFAQANLRTPRTWSSAARSSRCCSCCNRATRSPCCPNRWCATRSTPGCSAACRSRWAASSPTSAC